MKTMSGQSFRGKKGKAGPTPGRGYGRLINMCTTLITTASAVANAVTTETITSSNISTPQSLPPLSPAPASYQSCLEIDYKFVTL